MGTLSDDDLNQMNRFLKNQRENDITDPETLQRVADRVEGYMRRVNPMHPTNLEEISDALDGFIRRTYPDKPSEKRPDIVCFISYSHKNKNHADRLVSDLRSTRALIWIDRENIPPGARWDVEVEKAVKECTHFLLIVTPQSIESNSVRDEWNCAIDEGKKVIPLIFDPHELPFRLRNFQWIVFHESYEDGLKKLLRELGH